jgi:hypothetical protein
MRRPDIIVLVLNFKRADKSKTQVKSKNFILGEPSKGKKGILEVEVERKLGARVISCDKFSLIKYPITLPTGKAENRARGAIGLFEYLGTTEDVERTLRVINEICNNAIAKAENWSDFEIYTATRWLP